MPRKKIRLTDPSDAVGLVAYIEDHASRSSSKALLELVRQLPSTLRRPNLRLESEVANFNITTHAQKVAGAIHLRGQIAGFPCNNCQNGNGPFEDCVVLQNYDTLTKMCCSNCQWTLRTTDRNDGCDFARGKSLKFAIIAICTNILSIDRPPRQRNISPLRTLPPKVDPESTTLSENYNRLLKDGISPEDKGTRILGKLFLPLIAAQSEFLQAMVKPHISDLAALHCRDMSCMLVFFIYLLCAKIIAAFKKTVFDIERGFEEFKCAELKAWKESGSEILPPPEFLVKPSGLLSSPVSHRLNQPSFTTGYPENGETADRTNGCIAMVMGTVFDKDTFTYDQVHRRDELSNGSSRYPPFVRTAHQKWTGQISESLEAKVEVVYGRKAMYPILADPEVKITPLPLWGEYTGVILYLLREENFDNAQEGYNIRRLILSAHHPQRLFYEPANGSFATQQEKTLAAAAAMTGVGHIPGYYRNRLWAAITPSMKRRYAETILLKQRAQSVFD